MKDRLEFWHKKVVHQNRGLKKNLLSRLDDIDDVLDDGQYDID